MPADENPRYLRKLEAIITALEAENQRLTEQGQETLLRGSIAESISGMESPDDILAYTLKQIALIKDLPYCAFCELDDQKTLLRYSFATFQEENSIGGQINLSRDLIDTLEAGPLLLSEEDLVKQRDLIQLDTGSFTPQTVLILPCSNHLIQQGTLLIADSQNSPD